MKPKAESAPVKRDCLAIGVAATVAFALVLAFLTLASVPVKTAPGEDKVYHMLAFAVLAFPLPFVRPKLTAMVVAVAITYGGAIEVIQPFFGRQAELADLLADAVGAFIGATSGMLASRWAFRSPPAYGISPRKGR